MIDALLPLALVFCAMLILILALRVKRVRERSRVVMRPALQQTMPSTMPPGLALWLRAAAPVLVELGYRPLMNLHAPDIGGRMRWTQVVYLDERNGDRASVMAEQHGNAALLGLAFTTEVAEEPPVQTLVRIERASPDDEAFVARLRQEVRAAHARHRDAVAAKLDPAAPRLRPPAGREQEWLAERVGRAIEVRMAAAGWVALPARGIYLPPWRLATKVMWRGLMHRQIPAARRGFPIIPAPEKQ